MAGIKHDLKCIFWLEWNAESTPEVCIPWACLFILFDDGSTGHVLIRYYTIVLGSGSVQSRDL